MLNFFILMVILSIFFFSKKNFFFILIIKMFIFLKQMIKPQINKINSSMFLLLWTIFLFLIYQYFLGFFLHFFLFIFILSFSSIFFIYSIMNFFYKQDLNLYGWDNLKNIFMNLKILFFEIMTVLSRPLSLTLRLSINLMVGHIAGFMIYNLMGLYSGLVFFFIESFIIFLQISVFSILVNLYFNE